MSLRGETERQIYPLYEYHEGAYKKEEAAAAEWSSSWLHFSELYSRWGVAWARKGRNDARVLPIKLPLGYC